MHRKLITICALLLIFTISSCVKDLNINRIDSKHPVIVKMNIEDQVITGIKFPFELSVSNRNLSNKGFGDIIYKYGFKNRGAGIEIYHGNERIPIEGIKYVPAGKDENYFIYSRHFTDFSETTQNQLKPYVQKMLELNQDTLHVGTVAEFKEHHPELFKMLTENDTISIRHLKGRNSGLGERVAIPANW